MTGILLRRGYRGQAVAGRPDDRDRPMIGNRDKEARVGLRGARGFFSVLVHGLVRDSSRRLLHSFGWVTFWMLQY